MFKKIVLLITFILSFKNLFPVAQVVSATMGVKKTMTANGVSFQLVWCPPGNFNMGSPASEEFRDYDETEHPVTLTKGFWMMETEVTQELWMAVRNENPSFFSLSGKDAPVENVSWIDSTNFAYEMSKITGVIFQLPTEAQWEYACRAGTTTPFNTGRKITTDKANYDFNGPYNNKSKGKFRGKTTPVKSFAPNAWGLYDMHGNVWEWCADRYGAYPSQGVTDPLGNPTGSLRVFRGGCWSDGDWICRSAKRNYYFPEYRNNFIGLRLVCDML